ncbi:polysaccharide deacetylase family protein [Tessaracoccus massiliensis]|uniref:polysaccharide deacetylase family protein n=1 Tax=Tessaracoccus massiliensis TaxID=1522311 RepID=UPI00069441C9|nr:polysaccharide deacetylase family protein [Tessaracoccus massiliensis]
MQKWLTSPPESKHVFLTFDDGPNHAMTPKILDVLKEVEAPATFFVLGKEVEAAPDVLKREVAEGHAVGLHSYSHNYRRLYPQRRGDKDAILDEFDTSLAAVRRVLGADFTPAPWRYPGGHMSWKDLTAADEALASRGAHWIDWNALTGDAEPKERRPATAAAMVEMATRPIREGCHAVVLLAHDAPDKALTLATLPAVVAAYRSAGYEFNVIG